MRKLLRAFGLAVAAGAGLAACYPERASEGTDYASITTVYDSLIEFDSLPTFYLPDSVVHLVPVGGTDNISHSSDSLILATIVENMVDMGYTQEADPLLASLTLNPAITLSAQYDYAGLDWCLTWEDWAYPWTCTGWIPGYPEDVIGFQYSTGTLLIPMADLSGGVPPAVAAPPVVWLAGINGVANGSSAAIIAQELEDGINQAFFQSPYLIRSVP